MANVFEYGEVQEVEHVSAGGQKSSQYFCDVKFVKSNGKTYVKTVRCRKDGEPTNSKWIKRFNSEAEAKTQPPKKMQRKPVTEEQKKVLIERLTQAREAKKAKREAMKSQVEEDTTDSVDTTEREVPAEEHVVEEIKPVIKHKSAKALPIKV
jgi:hypothetical protein